MSAADRSLRQPEQDDDRARSVRGGSRGARPGLLAGRRKTEAVTHCPRGRRPARSLSKLCPW